MRCNARGKSVAERSTGNIETGLVCVLSALNLFLCRLKMGRQHVKLISCRDNNLCLCLKSKPFKSAGTIITWHMHYYYVEANIMLSHTYVFRSSFLYEHGTSIFASWNFNFENWTKNTKWHQTMSWVSWNWKCIKGKQNARVQPPGSTLTTQKIAGDKEKAQRRETVWREWLVQLLNLNTEYDSLAVRTRDLEHENSHLFRKKESHTSIHSSYGLLHPVMLPICHATSQNIFQI